MNFGEYLRENRLAMGISLEEVEEETKIRKYYIEALENEDFSVLPARFYACGFVKRYAQLLHLDQQQVLDAFVYLAYDHQQVGMTDEKVLSEPASAVRTRDKRTKKKLSIKKLAAAVIFLALVIVLGNFALKQILVVWQEKNPTNINEARKQSPIFRARNSDQNIELLIGTQEPEQTSEPQINAIEPSVREIRLGLELTDRCWLTVLVDGEQVLAQILQPGAVREYSASKSIQVRAGNAAGLIITLNGNELPPSGGRGEVKDYLFTIDDLPDG